MSVAFSPSLEATGAKFEDRGIQITRCYELDDDRVSVDPQLLEQVFVNVMLNAVDSMADGGELTITICPLAITEPGHPPPRE